MHKNQQILWRMLNPIKHRLGMVGDLLAHSVVSQRMVLKNKNAVPLSISASIQNSGLLNAIDAKSLIMISLGL